MLSKHPNLEAVVRAVEKKGFKVSTKCLYLQILILFTQQLFLLVRIAPHPFSIMNFLFSATNISLLDYTLGTAISLFKISLHVYIGANLTSFAKLVLGDEDEDLTPEQIKVEKIRYFVTFLFAILFAGVFGYIYRIAKKAVEEANSVQDEEEQLGFLSHQEHDEEEIELEVPRHSITRDSMSIDNWDNWDDEEEEDHQAATKSKLLESKND
jgi:cbb3-type cytochrome oxidase subunit 3